jgi:hypothetical protein
LSGASFSARLSDVRGQWPFPLVVVGSGGVPPGWVRSAERARLVVRFANAQAGGTGLTRVVQAATSTGRQGATTFRGPRTRRCHYWSSSTEPGQGLAGDPPPAGAGRAGGVHRARAGFGERLWCLDGRATPRRDDADHRHVMACVREVLAAPGVHVDPGVSSPPGSPSAAAVWRTSRPTRPCSPRSRSSTGTWFRARWGPGVRGPGSRPATGIGSGPSRT